MTILKTENILHKTVYLDTCPKNDASSFSRKLFCALRLRFELGLRFKFRFSIRVRVRVRIRVGLRIGLEQSRTRSNVFGDARF